MWSIIWAIGTNKNIYLLVTAFDILIYRWWYPQSVALEFAFVGMVVVYAIYQFIKLNQDIASYILKNSIVYTLKLISIVLTAMMMVDGYIRFF